MLLYLPAQPQHPLPVSPQFPQLVAQRWAHQDFCERKEPGQATGIFGSRWDSTRLPSSSSPWGTKMELLQSLQ